MESIENKSKVRLSQTVENAEKGISRHKEFYNYFGGGTKKFPHPPSLSCRNSCTTMMDLAIKLKHT